MKRDFEPVIKWSGSKRSVARVLAQLFPPAQRFFDPFVGGGAILPYVAAEERVAGDTISELIALWGHIQERPTDVVSEYAKRWERLQSEGHVAFYAIRSDFNERRDPLDLLFLTRTCVNGLIRFNSTGGFNNSLHHTRPGISPKRLFGVVERWSRCIQDVIFQVADYRETLSVARAADLIFLDPPYACNRGRYRPDAFDLQSFFAELERLNRVGAQWMLTFDGRAGERVYEGGVPRELYRHHLGVPTGNSPFTRLMGTALDAVTESVYLNFEPPSKALAEFSQLGSQPRRCRAASARGGRRALHRG
jgi:DNA adenine methylase